MSLVIGFRRLALGIALIVGVMAASTSFGQEPRRVPPIKEVKNRMDAHKQGFELTPGKCHDGENEYSTGRV